MFKLVGIRKSGVEFIKTYDSKEIAKFEFEITKSVAIKLELFDNDIIIDSYEYIQPEKVVYFINGESAFNKIHKRIEDRKDIAEITFKSEKARCNWITLYEEKKGERTLLECYVKGA